MIVLFLFLVVYLPYPIVAFTTLPDTTPFLLSSNTPLNNTTEANNDTSPTPLTDLAYLPHKFHVPNTDTYLRLGFGILRRPLDPMNMGSLLLLADDWIDQQIGGLGRVAIYPPMGDGRQEFTYEIGDGIGLSIWNFRKWDYWTWGVLKDVVEGLRIWLIEEGRERRCYFNFG